LEVPTACRACQEVFYIYMGAKARKVVTGMFNRDMEKKEVEVRILMAGLLLVPLLLLWEFYVESIRSLRGEWRLRAWQELAGMKAGDKGFPMVTDQPLSLKEYFDSYGLKMLIPHDLVLLAYSAAVILLVITIFVLARALLAVEEKDQERVKRLTDAGMKYFRYVLTLLIFFIVIHWIEESLFPFGTLFQENMWVIIGIALVITGAIRTLLGRVVREVDMK
jgi:hypothetical protein